MRTAMICYSLALAIGVASPVWAQTAPQAGGGGTMYVTKTGNIRAGAGTSYNVIGSAAQGQAVQITGPSPDGQWYGLANGGYISASLLSPNQVVVVAPVHHHHVQASYAPPPGAVYAVGQCEPYSRVVNIAGQPPQQINGEACMQPDHTWKIVNYGAPQPVPVEAAPPPPPVIVQQPVPVYAPPPVYYGRPYYR